MSQGVLSSIHISEFDPLELARQLTLMESALFCQIEPNEMIGQEFKKKVGCSTAVHVKAMIQRSTQITSWVSDTILRESDIKKRSQMIKLWIKVGDVSHIQAVGMFIMIANMYLFSIVFNYATITH